MTTPPYLGAEPPEGQAPPSIDVDTPSTARMYDYYLGGKNHYPADREAAERALAVVPDVTVGVRENRKFLARTVETMTEAGIRQFLDLGTGLPTQQNVHQVAQAARPDARVAYVDNDPVTLVHAQALLANDTQTTVAEADLRHPQQVLTHPAVTELIDFDEPVGVLVLLMLHFISDDEDPAGVVATFRDALAPGSYLALSHASAENLSPEAAREVTQPYDHATSTFTLRTRGQLHSFFPGFEVLEPGIVPVQHWRSDPADAAAPNATNLGGLGYKR